MRALAFLLAADGVVPQQAEAFEIVVEQDVEAVAWRRGAAGLRQPVAQRVAHQPSRAAFNRRDFDRGEPLRHRAAAAACVHRLEAAPGQGDRERRQQGEGSQQGAGAPHATILTSRSGTTITLRT